MVPKQCKDGLRFATKEQEALPAGALMPLTWAILGLVLEQTTIAVARSTNSLLVETKQTGLVLFSTIYCLFPAVRSESLFTLIFARHCLINVGIASSSCSVVNATCELLNIHVKSQDAPALRW